MSQAFLGGLIAIFILTAGGGILARATTRWGAKRRTGEEIGVAFAAGFLLAVFLGGVLHEAGSVAGGAAAFVVGFGLTFLLQARTHFHVCPLAADACEEPSHGYEGWVPALGLTLHSAIDGIVLASAQAVGGAMALPVAVAVGFHKVFDGFALGILLERAGVRGTRAFSARLAPFAATTPAFALATAAGLRPGTDLHAFAPLLLGLSGGAFLFFALDEVMPRARLHAHAAQGLGRAGFLFAVGFGILAGLAQVLTAQVQGW